MPTSEVILTENIRGLGAEADIVKVKRGYARNFLLPTGKAYEVTPVIGVVPPGLPLRASEAEVASVFEVPLAFLLDAANHGRGGREWRGETRRFYEIVWEDRRIWGATAAMIVNLSRRLRWS